MAARVTRRDFLNGVTIGAGGMLVQACGGDLEPAEQLSPGAPKTVTPPDSSA